MTGLKIDFWRDHLAKLASSGKAVSAYCRENGISPASIYHWRKRIEENPEENGFDEVTVASEEADHDFTLNLSALDQSILCRLVLMLSGQEHA
jgi:transposase-like protein